MTRRPSMQFYPSDFLGGTAMLSRAAVGAYIAMLCHSWETGPIPDTRSGRFKAMGLGPDDPGLDELWAEIAPKWILTPDGWINARLERTRADREAFIERQRENGRLGGRPPGKARTKPALSESKAVGFENAEKLKAKSNPEITPPTPTPTPISDLQSPEKRSARTERAPGAARAVHVHKRDVDTRLCRRGLCPPSFLRQEFHGQSGLPDAEAPAFVDGFFEWVLTKTENRAITGDPLKTLRKWWEVYISEGYALQGRPAAEDWVEECKRIHGGRCGARFKHLQFMKAASA